MKMETEHQAVIIGNGDFPTSPFALKVLNDATYVVCCDGGANEYIRKGYVPDAIVGDGDSLADDIKQQHKGIIHYNHCQETNDQTKAVNFLIEKGFKNITIIGATGKREDHTLGNISLLVDYMRMGVNIRTYTDYGIFTPCHDTQQFSSFAHQQVSIFNISATHLSSVGLQYPIYDFNNWWQGTLNEATTSSFTIEAQGDYIVFTTYEKK